MVAWQNGRVPPVRVNRSAKDGGADFSIFSAWEVWRAVQDSAEVVPHYLRSTEHPFCSAAGEDPGGHPTVGLQGQADTKCEQDAEESGAVVLR